MISSTLPALRAEIFGQTDVASIAPRSRRLGAWSAGTATTAVRSRLSAGHMAFDKIGHFTGAFADQANHHHFSIGSRGNHIKQHRFADA